MEPLTYRLNLQGASARDYYEDISRFADEVLTRFGPTLAVKARSFRRFVMEYGLESARSVEEYTYELLNLGTLWRSYGSTTLSTTLAPFRMLASLAEIRKKHPLLKPGVDVIRGFLLSFFLAPHQSKRAEPSPVSIADLEQLVRWLEATGDLREDAFRYVRWIAYWSLFPASEFEEEMRVITREAEWFDICAKERLGRYTTHVDAFLERSAFVYNWREDRFQCLRPRVEYHLNMLGAEILNRAFGREFSRTPKRAVLLPGCLRKREEGECEGEETPLGIRCTGCETGCKVNQARQLGRRDGFDVYVIPHSSDLSKWAPSPGEPATGVVASACLSVLVEGGWELRRYGVPAQCVLLNECGCRKHWHRTGIATHLDFGELRRRVRLAGQRTGQVA